MRAGFGVRRGRAAVAAWMTSGKGVVEVVAENDRASIAGATNCSTYLKNPGILMSADLLISSPGAVRCRRSTAEDDDLDEVASTTRPKVPAQKSNSPKKYGMMKITGCTKMRTP